MSNAATIRRGGAVRVTGLTWRPAGRRRPILEDFDLAIEPGEKILLVGPSGSGKSTLLRAIAGLLLTTEVGDLTGQVSVDGANPQETPGLVGLLLQDPSAGLVARTVGRDVAFGLENTGLPRADMPGLVRRALEISRFPYDELRRTDSLSDGETQRLALAGALALNPPVLLLDEPTSMLDDDNSAGVRRAVLEPVEAAGTTLVVVEHRLGHWVEHMDRCVILDPGGRVVADGRPDDILGADAVSLAEQGVWAPGAPDPTPLAVDRSLVTPAESVPRGEPIVIAKDIHVRHRSPFTGDRKSMGELAIAGISCELRAGRAVGLTGPSGAGKSTLLAVLAGLSGVDSGSCDLRPAWAGNGGSSLVQLSSVELARRLAWVPQLSTHGLVTSTVLDELMTTARVLGRHESIAQDRALGLLEVLGLGGLAHANPHHLSGGEQRRVVVAAALVHGPSGLLLDEPTIGQDRLTWAAVTGVCTAARDSGVGVAIASHDHAAVNLLAGSGHGEVLRLERGRRVGGDA